MCMRSSAPTWAKEHYSDDDQKGKEMHLSDAQKTAINKKIVVDKARDILAHKDEIADMGSSAVNIWNALLRSPTWSIVEGPKPDGWREPEEIWSEIPNVERK